MTFNRRQIFIDAWDIARKVALRHGATPRSLFRIALLTSWQKAKNAVKEAARQAAALAAFNRTDKAAQSLKAAGLLTGIALTQTFAPKVTGLRQSAGGIGR